MEEWYKKLTRSLDELALFDFITPEEKDIYLAAVERAENKSADALYGNGEVKKGLPDTVIGNVRATGVATRVDFINLYADKLYELAKNEEPPLLFPSFVDLGDESEVFLEKAPMLSTKRLLSLYSAYDKSSVPNRFNRATNGMLGSIGANWSGVNESGIPMGEEWRAMREAVLNPLKQLE